MHKHIRNILTFTCSMVFLTLTACTMTQQPIGNSEAPYPPAKPEVGDIYHLPTGVKISSEQMQAAITDVPVGSLPFQPRKLRLGKHCFA